MYFPAIYNGLGMQEKRAYKFRIYPDEKRCNEIDERLVLAQQLYNRILEKAKSEHQKNKNSKINKPTLNRYMKEAIYENKDFLKLYSQTRQDVFVRIRTYCNFPQHTATGHTRCGTASYWITSSPLPTSL